MSALEDWAASGAMTLTGRRHGPPLVSPGSPATSVRQALDRLRVHLPGLLGERAAYAGLGRRGPWSCGGAMRVLRTLDGHLALSLARPSDHALVPALVERRVDDAWTAVRAWAAGARISEAAERLLLLGLPGGAVGERGRGEPVRTASLGTRSVQERPLVVDLTSLWAGPLCARLLRRSGARVVKVESRQRPDGARLGPAGFFDLLNHGSERLSIDIADPGDILLLRDLIATADLVLEATRPRALHQLGIDAERVVRDGTSWLSITACGRDSDAVGFGDDVAARAGMVIEDAGDLLPVGDALADPLTGAVAAAAASDALSSTEARLIDVSMLDAVAACAGPIPPHETTLLGDTWWVEDDQGRVPVAVPRTRPCQS